MQSRNLATGEPDSLRARESLPDNVYRLLDTELGEIANDPALHVPRDRRMLRRHASAISEIIELRLGLVMTAMALAMVVIVALIPAGGAAVTGVAVAALLIATGILLRFIMRLMSSETHPSPQLDTALTDSGVGDPDRCLTELLADYRSHPAAYHRAAP